MWISRKHYNFLKENAEKSINAECALLTAKENQSKAVARAMEEYSVVLKERDELRLRVIALESQLKKDTKVEENVKVGYWEQGDMYDIGDVCSLCGYDSALEPCYLSYCPSCHAKMTTL